MGSKKASIVQSRSMVSVVFILVGLTGLIVFYNNVYAPTLTYDQEARAYFTAQSLATYMSFMSNVEEGETARDLNGTFEVSIEKKSRGWYAIKVAYSSRGDIKWTKDVEFPAEIDMTSKDGKEGKYIVISASNYIVLRKEPGKLLKVEASQSAPQGISIHCDPPPSQDDLMSELKSQCNRNGMEIPFAMAIMATENGMEQCDENVLSISSAGAMGLMQVMPGTGAEMGVTNLGDWRLNIEAGVKYLAYLKKTDFSDKASCHVFGEYPDWRKIVAAAYNGGPGSICKLAANYCKDTTKPCWKEIEPHLSEEITDYAQTRDYVGYVTCYYDSFKENPGCFSMDCVAKCR
jgi:hypothetical protein